MSDSSNDDDERKVASTNSDRMWAESLPGPSGSHPTRQGYCGCCKVVYSNLDQHLSSLRHLDSVHLSSRGNTKVTLLERFLEDVLQHHPSDYNDSRTEFNEVCQDNQSLRTQEYPSCCDDAFCQSANHKESVNKCPPAEKITDKLSASIPEQGARAAPTEPIISPQTQRLPPKTQSPRPVHRKAHRKSNRRKTSEDSSPPRGSQASLDHALGARPGLSPSSSPGYGLALYYGPDPSYGQGQKEDTFSADHSDNLKQTIEEVIQTHCYGISSYPHHQEQEEVNSLHFSHEAQSDDWDPSVQVHPALNSSAQGSQTEQLRWLMDLHVHVDDQVYASQLDCALNKKAGGSVQQDQGFWTLPIEQVLPVPKYIPECFKGKTWTQIEEEDEDKVEKLVCQFKQGVFICYFDSESLARYGRWRQNKERWGDNKKAACEPGVLPLLDFNDDSVSLSRRRRRRRRRRDLRLASRCQVVKVSHSTQTVQLITPAVHQPAPETPLPSVATPNAAKERWTPETWRFLPRSYSSIITPVQPQTPLVYLLCSPAGSAATGSTTTGSPAAGPSSRRTRKRRRPPALQGLKIKYRPLNMRFYDPGTNHIKRTPPKGFLWHRGQFHSNPPPLCVRQLFRSLSPDLNADRLQEKGAVRGSTGKGQRLSPLLGMAHRKKNIKGNKTPQLLPPKRR